MLRNGWPPWIGITGQNASDYAAQLQKQERCTDPESQFELRYAKAELKNTLAQLDLVLEGLKQLLILAIQVDIGD